MKIYQGFIVAVNTNFGKNIAFYVPYQFEETKNFLYLNTRLTTNK